MVLGDYIALLILGIIFRGGVELIWLDISLEVINFSSIILILEGITLYDYGDIYISGVILL